MRLRNIPGAEEALREYPVFVDEPTQYRGRWRDYFANDQPLHLEIGCGKGQFITTLAAQHPEINFIALEVKAEVLYRTAQRIGMRPVANLALIQANALQLTDLFAENELERIYLNFSDPWPKRRHRKRRLTHAQFLQLYRQVLKPYGEIHFKTDNEGLFEFSLNQFSEQGFQLRDITFDLHHSEFAAQNVMTEYETRFVSRGQRIYRTIAINLP